MSDEQEEEYQDLSKPRKVHHKMRWKMIQDAQYWKNLKKAQGWQTRSNAIILDDFVPADYIERVEHTKTK